MTMTDCKEIDYNPITQMNSNNTFDAMQTILWFVHIHIKGLKRQFREGRNIDKKVKYEMDGFDFACDQIDKYVIEMLDPEGELDVI